MLTHEIKKNNQYLQGLRDEMIFDHRTTLTFQTTFNVQTLLKKLNNFNGYSIHSPDMCPSDNLNIIMLTWNTRGHYLECEVYYNRFEFFYRNDSTNSVFGEDVPIDGEFSEELTHIIKVFCNKLRPLEEISGEVGNIIYFE
jgi:hypothetical protein